MNYTKKGNKNIMSNGIVYRTIKQYVKAKLKMLRRDFFMNITEEEEAHMYSLKTETAVDRYVRDLFFTKM